MTTKKKKPTSKVLKAYLEAKKHDSVLVGELDRYLQSRVSDRDATVIHPSEMASSDWCPRSTYLRLKAGKAAEQPPLPMKVNLIFSAGDAIHDAVQEWLADMGVLYGKWECLACGEIEVGYSNAISYHCDLLSGHHGTNRQHLWKYREVPLTDIDRGIAGHSDGIVHLHGKEEPILLEIKSIGPGTIRHLGLVPNGATDEQTTGQFAKITAPMKSHFMQSQIYMRLARENYSEQIGQVDRAVIFYVQKADQQYREFPIRYNPKWTEDVFEMAEDITEALASGRDVPCPYRGCAKCKEYE